MNFYRTMAALYDLVLYRNLLNDPALKLCAELAEDDDEQQARGRYYEVCSYLLAYYEKKPFYHDLWKNYVIGHMIEDENPFSRACERGVLTEQYSSLQKLARHDLARLLDLYHLNWTDLGQKLGFAKAGCLMSYEAPASCELPFFFRSAVQHLLDSFNHSSSLTDSIAVLMEFYAQHGSGSLAAYQAFYWDDGLVGIPYPDPIRLDQIIGYDEQKEILIRNTRAFLKGQGGNHVLLYGDRGTGKSSSVKALLHEFAPWGLRMVEMDRGRLMEFNRLIHTLRNRAGYYIVFIDDLSFEDFEVEYKYLKGYIEGSLEAPADNVRLYVTSNRRHLIRETWSERQQGDEIHVRDARQEKLSFADRFGLMLTYPAPDQDQYLLMVRKMARREGLNYSQDQLDRMALQWELGFHGRSGRSAQQFINDLKSRAAIELE